MRDDDEPDMCIGETLRDLGTKETGKKKPNKSKNGIFLRCRINFFVADEGKGDAEGDGCLDIAHRSEGAERDDA